MELGIIVAGASAGWIACGVVAYKATIAYFLREFASNRFTIPTRGFELIPERLNDHRQLAIQMGVIGPIGLLFVAIVGDRFKHGLSRPSVDELERLAREEWGEEAFRYAEQ